MFKNMKLGAKIGVGFGCLTAVTAVIAFAGWRGLSALSRSADLLAEANARGDQLHTCADLGFQFDERGFEKSGADGRDAAQRWQAAYDKLAADLEALSRRQGLTAASLADLQAAKEALAPWKAAFDHVVQARKMKDEAFEGWRTTGFTIMKTVRDNAAQVLDRERKAAEDTKDFAALQKVSEAGNYFQDNVLAEFLLLRVNAGYLLAINGEEQQTAYAQQLAKVKANTVHWSERVAGDAALSAVAKTAEDAIAEYSKAGDKYLAGLQMTKAADADRSTACEAVAAGCGAFKENIRKDTETLVAQLDLFSIVMGVGSVLWGVLLALVITRSITRPINRVIEGLTEGSEQVTAAASEVSAASQSLAQGCSEQAAAVEESSSSLEQMSAMTKQNAGSAGECKNVGAAVKESAEKGAEAMARMSRAIDEIKKSSDQTAKIVKTIDEIAFQTNLLALNAAVEAARAGDAGRGFAVVAEEVRNLAQRAGEAARNTASMIEESVKNSENGVQLSREVAQALTEIAESARKVSDLAAEVAAASTEQAQGIDQVNMAVSQIDSVTQQNAANAEESASASEQLNAQAVELDATIGQLFALVGGASRAAARMQVRAVRPEAGAHRAGHPKALGMNCWEGKNCGRIPGGTRVNELGVCPAYPNNGRRCWLVAGTFCRGKVPGSFAGKLHSCTQCAFYKQTKGIAEKPGAKSTPARPGRDDGNGHGASPEELIPLNDDKELARF